MEAARARPAGEEAVRPSSDAAIDTLGLQQVRDARADRRDEAAQARDELAAGRDRNADLEDEAALELDGVEGLSERCTLGVRELRALGVEGRERAALGRRRARQDRALAGADREFGGHDREESRRDREHAGMDELTGARRRGVGMEDLQREIDRARRTGASVVAAYVDVDGLKAVNDGYGHSAGDQILRDVVTELRRDMRSYDLLVRLGGDEFLCVMPGMTADQARRRFARLAHNPRRGPLVSIGLSQLRDGEGAIALVDRADKALLATRRARQRR